MCESEDKILAAWIFQPPPYGAAKSVSSGEPQGCLSLSRMVAVPKKERDWHLSKPLRWLLKKGLDRGRYPVIVTYADEGEGHCGNVYKCAGMQRDGVRYSTRYNDSEGRRRSIYTNGGRATGLVRSGKSKIIRFVHRVCEKGDERKHMEENGWRRVPTGKVWRSGNPGFTWVS